MVGLSHDTWPMLPLRDSLEPSFVRNVSRRVFLMLCGITAALLGLGASAVPRIAYALEHAGVQHDGTTPL